MIMETRPRRHGHPIMAEEYHVAPWQIEDLTPLELAAIIADLNDKAEHAKRAQQEMARGGRR